MPVVLHLRRPASGVSKPSSFGWVVAVIGRAWRSQSPSSSWAHSTSWGSPKRVLDLQDQGCHRLGQVVAQGGVTRDEVDGGGDLFR